MKETRLKSFNKSKITGLVIFIVLLLIYSNSICIKLAGGARWSSGLPLGGVDNYLYENGSMYTVPVKGFTPGSSYFPGIVLLCLLFRTLFGYGAEVAIILFGAMIAFFSFWGFSRIVSDNKQSRFWYAVLAAVFFRLGFVEANSYLLEMHPDIPALVFFLWGIIGLEAYLKNEKKVYLIFVMLAFWCSGLFKQTSVALYIGLGLYVLFSKSISIKNKILIFFIEFISGIATLLVVFAIKGCWYNCIVVNSLHSLVSIKTYFNFGYTMFRNNKLFIIFAFVYLILLISKNILLERRIEKMWFSTALAWFFICMYGAAKDGANSGNMEAGLIALMPFCLIVMKCGYNYFKKYIDTKGIANSISSINNKRLVYSVFSIFICLAVILFSGKVLLYSYHQLSMYKQRRLVEKEFVDWLNSNYKGKNVAYNTIVYELLNGADVHKTTDLYTFLVWGMGGLVTDEDLQAISEKESWDVIITRDGIDESRYPITFSNFRQLPETLYPDISQSYGTSVEIFVRE